MITDFVYDGRSFADEGYIPCDFSSSGGVDVIDMQIERSFDHLSFFNGKE
jgi:hypothetical protein